LTAPGRRPRTTSWGERPGVFVVGDPAWWARRRFLPPATSISSQACPFLSVTRGPSPADLLAMKIPRPSSSFFPLEQKSAVRPSGAARPPWSLVPPDRGTVTCLKQTKKKKKGKRGATRGVGGGHGGKRGDTRGRLATESRGCVAPLGLTSRSLPELRSVTVRVHHCEKQGSARKTEKKKWKTLCCDRTVARQVKEPQVIHFALSIRQTRSISSHHLAAATAASSRQSRWSAVSPSVLDRISSNS